MKKRAKRKKRLAPLFALLFAEKVGCGGEKWSRTIAGTAIEIATAAAMIRRRAAGRSTVWTMQAIAFMDLGGSVWDGLAILSRSVNAGGSIASLCSIHYIILAGEFPSGLLAAMCWPFGIGGRCSRRSRSRP